MFFQSVLTDAGALQDQWGAECATADNDELAGLVDLGLVLGDAEGLGWHSLDAYRAVTLKDNPARGQYSTLPDRHSRNSLLDLGVDNQVQVSVVGASAVDVRVGAVRSATSIPVDPLEPVLSSVACHEILQVIGDRDVLALYRTQEVLHDRV